LDADREANEAFCEALWNSVEQNAASDKGMLYKQSYHVKRNTAWYTSLPYFLCDLFSTG
jgi:hypothetical protein